MFNGTLKVRVLLILVGDLKTVIAVVINIENIIIFKCRNFKFDLNDNFVNN